MTSNGPRASGGVEIAPLDMLLSWARERYKFRWQLRAEVLRFIRSYQGGPADPRSFVGRATLLQNLDEWLQQKDAGFRLLSGKAGRGKSALLLHWLGKLTQRASKPTIVYLPISIRFNTADESSGVALLFSALCDIFGELKQGLPERPVTEDYLQGIGSAWELMARQPEQSFLLVVDGLDEAVNQWPIRRRILPGELPSNLHVLISARNKPGHMDGTAWLDELDAPLLRNSSTGQRPEHLLIEVATLDRAAMAEAMIQLRKSLDHLRANPAFVDALYHLTDDGDPLLLTLWLGQICKQRDGQPDMTAEALATLQASFEGFYALWKAEQQSLWKAQGLAILAADFEEVLQVLSVAHGPLRLEDLVEVLAAVPGSRYWEPEELRAALQTAHRLVLGDGAGSGYVLVHPRLAQYFSEERAAGPLRVHGVQAAFRAWGARTVGRLNSAELPASECPRYLLVHYVAHLDAMDASAAEALDEFYLPLLHRGWPAAWYESDGSWHGYLNDLQRVLERVHAFNLDCVRNRPQEPLRLAAQVRCTLIAASIRSMTLNVPPQLITALVRAGVWSLSRARRVAGHCREDSRAACLVELAAMATETGARSEALEVAQAIQDELGQKEARIVGATDLEGDHGLLQQALQAARAIEDEGERAYALQAMAAQLQGDRDLLQQAAEAARTLQHGFLRAEVLSVVAVHLRGDHGLLRQALEAALAIEEAQGRAVALRAVAAHLQGDRDLLQQALEAARAIPSAGPRAVALSAVAADLQGENRETVVQEALEVARMHEDKGERAAALTAVAAHLQGASRDTVLYDALQSARAAGAGGWSAYALRAVAAELQGQLRHRVLQEALQAVREIGNEEGMQAVELTRLVVLMRGDRDLLQQALEAVRAMHGKGRVEALTAVAAELQGEARHTVLQEALRAAGAIQDESWRVSALGAVGTQLQGEARHRVLRQALEAARAIQDESWRADALSGVVARQPDHALLREALEVARAIRGERPRAEALGAVAAQLQGDARHTVLQEALATARAMQDQGERANAVSTVAGRLQGDRNLLREALEATRAIQQEARRADTLSAVVAQLRGDHDLLQRALEAAREIQDETAQATALQALALQLQGEQDLLQQALEMARTMQGDRGRACVLSALAAQLQGERDLLQQALEEAQAIRDESWRAHALSAIASQLQGERDLLLQALQTARAIQDAGGRAVALSAVAAHLQDRELLHEALDTARAIQDEGERGFALRNVAARLPRERELLQVTLQSASAIESEVHRAQTLGALAAQLQGDRDLLQGALQATRAIEYEGWRAAVLRAIAAGLQGDRDLLREALEMARTLQDEEIRAPTLQAIAAQLQGDAQLQAACLEEASKLPVSGEERLAITLLLVHQNPTLMTYERWFDLLERTRLTRAQLLACAGDLAWSAVQLTGRIEEAQDIAVAIADVCEWWP